MCSTEEEKGLSVTKSQKKPIDLRPVFRTSVSLNLIHWPNLVTNRISFVLSVTFRAGLRQLCGVELHARAHCGSKGNASQILALCGRRLCLDDARRQRVR